MNTKTCKKCGWVYPKVTPYTTCRFCGMSFTEGTCKKCGDYSYDILPGTGWCRTCYNARQLVYQKGRDQSESNRKVYEARCKEADERFAAWTGQLRAIKTHTLTEDEWMEACRHFGGCALCGADSIDARGYFIRFEDGGNYNACNVIPLCDKCATALKYQSNPFRQMNPYINRSLAVWRGLSVDRLNKVAEYLQEKIGGIDHEQ